MNHLPDHSLDRPPQSPDAPLNGSPASMLRWLLLLVTFGCFTRGVFAQSGRLYESEPFDTITLSGAADQPVIKVLPLDFPGRTLPVNPKPTDMIRVRLLERPDEQFDIQWSSIQKIELFEQRLLDEAQRLIKSNQFDEAFDYLAFLKDKYPKLTGLDEVAQRFLEQEAQVLFKEGKYERAWFLLDESYRSNPGRPAVNRALRVVLERMFSAQINELRFADARRTLEVTAERYANEQQELLARWRETMERLGRELMSQAEQHLSAGRHRDAYLTSRRLMELWPETPGARELARRITSAYPIVVVAVLQSYAENDGDGTNNVAVRRCRRLLRRNLFEMTDASSEGGQYACPFASHTVSDDGTQVQIQLRPAENGRMSLSAMSLARQLQQTSDRNSPAYDATWASLFDRATVDGVWNLQVQLRRPHLRFESLLDRPVELIEADSDFASPYRLSNDDQRVTTFVVNERSVMYNATQPREVIEKWFANSQAAIAALRRGEVDTIARVFPAEAALLAKDQQVRVGSLRIPSTHALIPNYRRTFPAARSFRLALLYGIDRERILKRDLLGGRELAGCQVISGIFPPGFSSDDPIGYAYDPKIEPRPYEPRLARIRLQIAVIEAASEAKKLGHEPPETPSLTIYHPDDEIPRLACQEIANDIRVLGLDCQLKALPAGRSTPDSDEWDFLYADLRLQEPLVDARRILSYEGSAACISPYLNLSIRQLDQATNWIEAGQRLRAIHQNCFDDASVLPLWQLVDHFAYRPGIEGMVEHPVEIYQNVEQWRVRSE
jgi:hypothetical protein